METYNREEVIRILIFVTSEMYDLTTKEQAQHMLNAYIENKKADDENKEVHPLYKKLFG